MSVAYQLIKTEPVFIQPSGGEKGEKSIQNQ